MRTLRFVSVIHCDNAISDWTHLHRKPASSLRICWSPWFAADPAARTPSVQRKRAAASPVRSSRPLSKQWFSGLHVGRERVELFWLQVLATPDLTSSSLHVLYRPWYPIAVCARYRPLPVDCRRVHALFSPQRSAAQARVESTIIGAAARQQTITIFAPRQAGCLVAVVVPNKTRVLVSASVVCLVRVRGSTCATHA